MRQNFITGAGKIKIVPIGWSSSRIIRGAVKLDGPSDHGRSIVIKHLAKIRDCLIGIKSLPYSGQKPNLSEVVLASKPEPIVIRGTRGDDGKHQRSRAL